MSGPGVGRARGPQDQAVPREEGEEACDGSSVRWGGETGKSKGTAGTDWLSPKAFLLKAWVVGVAYWCLFF